MPSALDPLIALHGDHVDRATIRTAEVQVIACDHAILAEPWFQESVQRIVIRRGGQIALTSEEERGTTIVVRLPISDA